MPVARAGWSAPAETSDERARRTKPIASRSFVLLLDFGISQRAPRSSGLETARVSLSIVVVWSTTLYYPVHTLQYVVIAVSETFNLSR
jgi:hypothetical protein